MNRTLKLLTLALPCACLVACDATQPRAAIQDPWSGRFPMIELVNEHVTMLVMSPDEQAGLNRASRFDRAGMVVFARTTRGHTYFGPTVEPAKHDPSIDDHVAGTAGEFGMKSPWGYDQAQPGDIFVKIGVGALRRMDDKPYFFRRNYPLVDAGDWRIASGADRVTMTQSLDGPGGWAYRYRTQVSLLEDGPGFIIERTLTNTGKQVITTDYYNHNFIVLDGQPVSPAYELALSPAHQVAQDRTVPQWAQFEGNRFHLTDELPPGKALWLPLNYEARSQQPWRAAIRHADGAAVTLDQEPAPDHVVIYVKRPYLSVEPFIDIDLQPGQSITWTARYELE